MNVSDINVELMKISDKVICPKCRRITSRENIKYVRFILNPYVLPRCNKCRDKYRNSKLMRFFTAEI